METETQNTEEFWDVNNEAGAAASSRILSPLIGGRLKATVEPSYLHV